FFSHRSIDSINEVRSVCHCRDNPGRQVLARALFYSSPGSVVNLDVAAAFRCSVTPSEQPFSSEEITGNEDSKRDPPNGIDGSPQWRNCPARRFSATLSLPNGRNNLKANSIDGLTSSRALIRRGP